MPDGFTMADAKAEFERYERRSIWVFLLAWLLLGGVSGTGLMYLNSAVHFSADPSIRILLPSPALWYGMGSVLCLCLIGASSSLVNRWLLQDRYGAFNCDQSLRYGMTAKFVMSFFVVVAGCATVFLTLGFNSYTRFDGEGIAINPFWGLSEARYRYYEIVQLRHVESFTAPNGRIVKRPHYAIRFPDRMWRTKDGGRDEKPEEDAELFEFPSRKTGLPVTPFHLDPDD